MSCNACGKSPAELMCSDCRKDCNVKHRYCSRECQKKDWSSHKFRCGAQEVVLIDGSKTWAEKWPRSKLAFDSGSWDKCPVPKMLGIPIWGLKHIRPSPVEPMNQLATWMFLDPKTGWASLYNYKWMGGPHNQLGVSVLARKDRKKFTEKEFWVLYDYIYTHGETVADGIRGYKEVWNKDKFEEFRKENEATEEEYNKFKESMKNSPNTSSF